MAQLPKFSAINNNSGDSQSLWMEVELPAFPALEESLKADVCIVGAGIAGLTCAYTLAKKGKSVIVIDQGSIGGGQSARTTAHLTWVLDERFFKLEKLFGIEGAKMAAESHSEAINYIEKIVEEEEIDCDFQRVDGYLFITPEKAKDEHILNEEATFLERIEMPFHKINRAPFPSSFKTGSCLHYPNQGQFHILKYIRGLTKAILKNGGKIFANTHAESIVEESNGCIVRTEKGYKIESQSIIIATCTPINNRFYIHTKQAAYRSYVLGATIPKNAIQKGLYWDTCDPYHYIRTQPHTNDPEREWIIIGGEDHKTGQCSEINKKYVILEKWARLRFPMMQEIKYRWSGQVFEPIDGLGFIGRNPGNQNIYIATGDSGNGMTHGTIAGILIPDLIVKNENVWKNLYEPSRKTFSAGGSYLKENLNVIWQYRDWLTPGEIKEIEELSPNNGMLLRKGLKKIAVYKDAENKVCLNSAFCPHLGGCVRWNSGEKSWDCPCHGSRFDGYGRVITGPSIDNLPPI